MTSKQWAARRRDLLRGLGVGLGCMPLLHAERALGAPPPKRLLLFILTNGYRMATWRPPQLGPLAGQTLPEGSSPLEPWKSRLLFLTDMTFPSFPGPNGHGAYVSHLCAGPTTRSGEYQQAFTPSVDQVVGQAIARREGLPRATLNLGILIDQGHAGEGLNSKRCIFRGKDQPINPEQNPYRVYATLFGGADTNPAAAQAAMQTLRRRQSILDFVGRDLERFRDRLGTEDRLAVEGHLQGVRDLERQLEGAPVGAASCRHEQGAMLNHADQKNFAALVDVNIDLMVAAVRCDLTRVVTLQVTEAAGAHISWSFLTGIAPTAGGFAGALGNWHDLAHGPYRGGIDQKLRIDKWLMQKFARLLGKLEEVRESGGTLLDSGVVLCTNPMQDGANHNSQKQPWLLAGTCQGFFKNGVNLAESRDRPVNGVLAEVCNAMGVPVEHFGDPSYGRVWPGLRRTA